MTNERSRPVTQPNNFDTRSSSAMPKRKVGSRFTSGHLLMIISGLLAFLLTVVALSSRGEKIEVFVANNDIVAGEVLTLDKFKSVDIPSSSFDDNYVSESVLRSGKSFASRSIFEGEALTKGDLTPQSSNSGVRLMSIPIDRSLAVNGEIAKGDRIDIVAAPEGECAYRALINLEVTSAPRSGSSGGVLSSGSGRFVITVAIEEPGQDLTLAGIIENVSFQIVKTTGINNNDDLVVEDELCGSPPSIETASEE